MIGFPYDVHPTGWFQFGWSGEYEPGSVKPLRHFDADLVAFRDADGDIRVFDAYCPHLGANLAMGGCVQGKNLECPFHGWQWGPQGENALVPYGNRPFTAASIKVWETRELDGLLWIWHDAEGHAPIWEPPELPETRRPGEFAWSFPQSVRAWPKVRMVPQQQTENIVDVPHIKFVHKSASVPEVESYEEHTHRFDLVLRQEYPTSRGSRTGRNELSAMGVGITHSRLTFDDQEVLLVASVIPVEGLVSDLRISLMTRLRDGESVDSRRVQAVNEAHFLAADQDLPIWENQRYVERAPLVKAEASAFLAFRRWARRFYGDEPALSPTGLPRVSAVPGGEAGAVGGGR
jgi:3-ketosteroid 9alpha-monooxygenase subunit A